jgi:hypothetical protein
MVGGVTTLTGTPTLSFNLLGGVTTGTYTVLESTGGFVGNTSGWTVNLGGRGASTPLTINGNLLQFGEQLRQSELERRGRQYVGRRGRGAAELAQQRHERGRPLL